MGIRSSAFAPCKYFFALAAVTEKVFSTITLTNYEYFAVAILVDKWVASIRVCNYKLTTCVAILADKKVNKFNREMLQIVHFPFLCCQSNSS